MVKEPSPSSVTLRPRVVSVLWSAITYASADRLKKSDQRSACVASGSVRVLGVAFTVVCTGAIPV